MNLTLIGMPGVGKSRVGKALANGLSYSFLDIDLMIEQQQGKTLQEIINDVGEEAFLDSEEKIIVSLSPTNAIISPGGSVIYSSPAMDHLKDISTVIYLSAPYKTIEKNILNLETRGIIGLKEKGLLGLYNERVPLYEKYADIRIDVRGGDVVGEIIQKYGAFPIYLLIRTDDNGNSFLVKDGLTQTAAEKLVAEYTAKGHKQHYTMHAYKKGELYAFLKKEKVNY